MIVNRPLSGPYEVSPQKRDPIYGGEPDQQVFIS